MEYRVSYSFTRHPHSVAKDDEYGGCKIPKNSTIVMNVRFTSSCPLFIPSLTSKRSGPSIITSHAWDLVHQVRSIPPYAWYFASDRIRRQGRPCGALSLYIWPRSPYLPRNACGRPQPISCNPPYALGIQDLGRQEKHRNYEVIEHDAITPGFSTGPVPYKLLLCM